MLVVICKLEIQQQPQDSLMRGRSLLRILPSGARLAGSSKAAARTFIAAGPWHAPPVMTNAAAARGGELRGAFARRGIK